MTYFLLALSIAAYVICMLRNGSISRNLLHNTPDQLFYQFIRDGLGFLLMAVLFRALIPSGYTLFLSALMGAAFLISTVFGLAAYAKGPVSVSILIISSLAMVISSLTGPLFWKESISILQIIGIVLSVVSMALLMKPEKNGKVSLGWLVAVILSGIGGGMQGPIQKVLATSAFASETNEFITGSFFFSALSSLLLLLIVRKRSGEQITCKADLRVFAAFGLQSLLAVFLNINNLRLVAELPTFIFFPAYSMGGLLITTVASCVLFKEKLSTLQKIGFGAGIAALFLISGVSG